MQRFEVAAGSSSAETTQEVLSLLARPENTVVELHNADNFVQAVISVAERVKRERSSQKLQTLQANLLEVGESVYAESDPQKPLQDPKLRYRIPSLTIRLSNQPLKLDDRAWTTQ